MVELIFVIISVLSSFGLSIVLVEKGEEFPANLFVPKIKSILGLFHDKLPNMLECTVCTSFWTSLVVEITMLMLFGYFLWPLSGLIVVGFTWLVMEFLNAIDKPEPTEDREQLDSVLENINEAFQEENQKED